MNVSATMKRFPVGVLGTGSYLPKQEVTNDDVAGEAGVTASWIVQKTQISSRRRAAPYEATSDLAAHAASYALEQAGVSAEQLGYVIVATSTPDMPQPPAACLVQDLLGAPNAACFDINVACSGFVYGLAVARGLLLADARSYALLIGADVYSRIVDRRDRSTAVLFGDGAGAVVLGRDRSGHGILDVGLHTRGDVHELIVVPAGGSRLPTAHDTVDVGGHLLAMRGRGVRDFVLQEVPPALSCLAERAGVRKDEIDHFIPHQPDGNLLDDLVVRAGLQEVTMHRTVQRYGNLGAASIPVTLDEANRSGALGAGDLLMLTGFGGGMSIGACLLRWSACTARPTAAG